MSLKTYSHSKASKLIFVVGILLVALALLINQQVVAQEGESAQAASPGMPLHPTFPLLDEEGNHVLDSGKPVSTMQTCSGCHDSAFIAGHSFHADVGLSDMTEPGQSGNGRVWDTSPGLFGKWNPITYRYLSPDGDERIDLTTAEWLQVFGVRHVGGGPAVYSRGGEALTDLAPSTGSVENSIVDPDSGELVPWNWQESGIVEMNCFLCHLPNPDNGARIEAIKSGEFRWANSATLLGTGSISRANGALDGSSLRWNEAAFDEDGMLVPELVMIQDPGNDNCGFCHGLVHVDAQTPTVLSGCTPEQWSTVTTGQIMSPQKISESGINLEGKDLLRRSWDIHTERVVRCTDCHYSLNNPVYYQELTESRPDHLVFDPRRIDLGEYLYRPLHQFAKGQSAQGTVAPGLDDTVRSCDSCHRVADTHDWLPYPDRHMIALSCESCHIPQMYAPARQSYDWTVLRADGEPQVTCRGIEGGGETFATALISGYEPVLLPRPDGDVSTKLSPHNLITSWYWVYGDSDRPVPFRDLQAAWLEGDDYHPDVLAAFDGDGDGHLDETELIIDNREKETFIAARLEALGLKNPQIAGEVQPYNINHNVINGEWATKDCQTCHNEDSRISQPLLLAGQIPGGVVPTFIGNDTTLMNGDLITTESGELYYQPKVEADNLYVLGHSNVRVVDQAGIFIFVGTLLGIVVHGGLRFFSARRNLHQGARLKEVYMYGIYERLWHWLQTVAIVVLLLTGLVIHKPDLFGIFSFRYVVQVHNIVAIILVANAALALFYHLASGEIRQYLPQPRGFFSQSITQTTFYLRGIFRGEEHPFEKTPQRKLNPLQQITYLGLLNVLLPGQIITGILMWGAQRWPQLTNQIGGLTYLGPIHSMISWLLASFVVMHVYLTTTGATPLTGIRAMITGWDDVEVHAAIPGD